MSMKPLSESTSSIIGGLEARPAVTGTLPIETGSARPRSFPRPRSPFCQGDPRDELLPLIRPIASDGTALLLSWLRFGETPLETKYLARAVKALEKFLADLAEWSRPSEAGEVLDVLELVARTIQVELSEDDGLIAYVAILMPFPPHVLKQAAIDVLRTHTVRTMPLPAEWLATGAVREWTIGAESMAKLARFHLQQLQDRLEKEQADGREAKD